MWWGASWGSGNADNEMGFRIERSMDGVAREALGLAGADQESFSDKGSFEDEIGQKGSGTYFYQVCRENGSECSEIIPVVF
jgi:hypothetical protein